MREWGKPQGGFVPGAGASGSSATPSDGTNGSSATAPKGLGSKGPQSYQKPVGFVREGGADAEMSNGDDMGGRGGMEKTDEEMEMDRREARRRDEESSYRDVSIPILFLPFLNTYSHPHSRPHSPARTPVRTTRTPTYNRSRAFDGQGETAAGGGGAG
jgi:hypothetical protein